MKKSLFLLSILSIFAGISSFAQEYKHGLGVQLNISQFKESYSDNTGLHNKVGVAPVPGVVYKASLGFQFSRQTTFSLSSYPFVGYSFNSSQGGYFGAELPILAELFFGDVDYFGAFIGAGASYSYTTYEGFGDGVVMGPQIEAGLQFPLGERVAAVKLAYTYGLNDPSISAFPDRVYTKSERGLFSVGFSYVFDY